MDNKLILLIIILTIFTVNIIVSVIAFISLRNKTGPQGIRGILGPRGIVQRRSYIKRIKRKRRASITKSMKNTTLIPKIRLSPITSLKPSLEDSWN